MRRLALIGVLTTAGCLVSPAFAEQGGERPAAAPDLFNTAPNKRAKIDLEKLYQYDSLRGSSRPSQPYVRPLAFGSFGYYGGYYGAPYSGYPYYGYYYSASGPYLFRDYSRNYSGYFLGYDGYYGRGYYYNPGPVHWRNDTLTGGNARR